MEQNASSTSHTISMGSQTRMGCSTPFRNGRSYVDVVKCSNSISHWAPKPQLRTDNLAVAIPNGVWHGVAHNNSVSSKDTIKGLDNKLNNDAYLANTKLRDDDTRPRKSDFDAERTLSAPKHTQIKGTSAVATMNDDAVSSTMLSSTCASYADVLGKSHIPSLPANPSDGLSQLGNQLCQRQDATAPVDEIKASQEEGQTAKLGYVKDALITNEDEHDNTEVSIKDRAEDTVVTRLGTIKLSEVGISIYNEDGLHPKLASDLDNFNNGFIEIKKSPIAGYGIFAARDLEPSTPVLIEKELINATPMNLFRELDKLTKEQLKAYNALHYHVRDPLADRRVCIWHTNRFNTTPGDAVLLVASRFNHACPGRNNVTYAYDYRKKCLVYQTTTRVAKGKELFISYSGNPIQLLMTWGFRCTCGCVGISDALYEDLCGDPWGHGGW